METKVQKCQSCGAPFNCDSDVKRYKCEYCGAVNIISETPEPANKKAEKTAQKARPAKIMPRKTHTQERLDELMQDAFDYLHNSGYDDADYLLSNALRICHDDYRVYLGKLMVELNVDEEFKLEDCTEDLSHFDNYNKLLQYAPESERNLYEKYNETIKKRIEEHEREEIRLRLKAEEGDKKFRKTAIRIAVSCIAIIGVLFAFFTIKNMITYKMAEESFKAQDYAKAVKRYEAVGFGYKDIKEKVKVSAYFEAERLFNEGDYLQASRYYLKANGYKDTLDKQRLITKAINIYPACRSFAYTKKDGSFCLPKNPNTNIYDDMIPVLNNLREVVYLFEKKSETTCLLKDGSVIDISTKGKTYIWPDPWRNIVKLRAYATGSVGLRSDGRLVGLSGAWDNIEFIDFCMGSDYTFAITKDGDVINYVISDYQHKGETSSWKNIKAISIADTHSVGLSENGKVWATSPRMIGVSEWTDIYDIFASLNLTVGLKKDGSVVTAGSENEMPEWKEIVYICGDFGLKSNGDVLFAGYDKNIRNKVMTWKNIVYIKELSYNNIVGLMADGTVVSTDSNYTTGLNFSDIAINIPQS
jgi:hypothetical protein